MGGDVAILGVAAAPGAEQQHRGQRDPAAHRVHHHRAGEVMELGAAVRFQPVLHAPAVVPGQALVERVEQADHGEGGGKLRLEAGALGDAAGHDGRHRGGERQQEEEAGQLEAALLRQLRRRGEEVHAVGDAVADEEIGQGGDGKVAEDLDQGVDLVLLAHRAQLEEGEAGVHGQDHDGAEQDEKDVSRGPGGVHWDGSFGVMDRTGMGGAAPIIAEIEPLWCASAVRGAPIRGGLGYRGWRSRKRSIRAFTSCGRSRPARWAVCGMTTNSAPGMESAIARVSATGKVWSSSPATTSTGVRIVAISACWSGRYGTTLRIAQNTERARVRATVARIACSTCGRSRFVLGPMKAATTLPVRKAGTRSRVHSRRVSNRYSSLCLSVHGEAVQFISTAAPMRRGSRAAKVPPIMPPQELPA